MNNRLNIIGPTLLSAHIHDLHATILHLMGLDHKRLTYRQTGRDYRLPRSWAMW